jgi:signal transduction histidine kinase/CheY-like chemotaxis protein
MAQGRLASLWGCCMALLLCCAVAHAAPALTLHAGTSQSEDYRALQYFCLPAAQAPAAAAVLPHPEQWPWQAAGPGVPNRGLTRDACWFRLRVANADNPACDWFLVIDQSLLQLVDVYLLDAQGRVQHSYFVGSDRPFGVRPYPAQSFAFPLRLEPGSSPVDVLMRIQTTSLQLPLKLMEARRFADEALVGNLIQGLFFGSMLIMILYNLFLYFSIREPAYLLYVCWSLVVTLIQADLHGLGIHFLWPEATYVMPLLLPGGVIFGSLFTLNFLSLRQRWPRAALVLRAHVLLGLLALGFALVADQFYSLNVSVPLFLSMDLGIFFIAVCRTLRGDADARIFSMAWLCFILGAAALALDKLNLLPHNLFTANLAQLGSFIEVALLSLALADRIKRLKTSTASAELEAIAANTRSKASSEFLATMSHEIRTPMNGVLGLTDLLRHTPLDAQQLQYVDTIYRSSNTLLAIINDILDYSRIEAGQLRLESINTPVEQLLDECVSLFAARANEKGLHLLTFVEPEVPAVIASDPARLKQILNNLLSNAIKFTERGEVRLLVRCKSGLDDGRLLLEFVVEDSGIGLSAEERLRLFRAFSQADSSTTRRYGGSGLGLSICRSLCELMGGAISVDSSPGVGSRFWFQVPASMVEQSALAATLHGHELLLAVAEPSLRASLSQLARRWGMPVSLASDAHHAATLLAEAEPDRFAALLLGPEAHAALGLFTRCRQPVLILHEQRQLSPPGSHIVWVELPLRILHLRAALGESLSPAAPVATAPAPAEAALARLRVLVAEDNPVNQVVIRSILKSAGIEPSVVANGRAALEEVAAADAHWDVVFMDCEMPEMDGYEATRRIRALEESRGRGHCWIVALSAHAVLEYIQKARQAGVDDYLSKPISRQQVLDALQRAPAMKAVASQ